MTLIDSVDPAVAPYKLALIKRGGDSIIDLLLEIRKVTEGCFIAGGMARWMLSPQENPAPPGDIDLYFTNQLAFDRTVNCLLTQGFQIIADTTNAISFVTPNIVIYRDVMSIQAIKPTPERSGSYANVLNNFDFTISQAAVMLINDSELRGVVADSFFRDEAARVIQINKMYNPILTIMRFMKYSRKGYMIRNKNLIETLLKWNIFAQINKDKIEEIVNKGDNLYDLLDLT